MRFYGHMTEPMTVSQFYADERRRASPEVTLGLEWRHDSDPEVIYGLHWIEQTKEIYVLRGPQAPPEAYAPHFPNSSPAVFIANDAYEVIMLGCAEDEVVLRRALAGWEAEMARPNSLQWVRERLHAAAGQTTINGP